MDAPTAREGLHDKYKHLAAYIEKLEPSTVTQMYKEYKSANTFFPNLGLFFNEFALVYSVNANQPKRSETKAS